MLLGFPYVLLYRTWVVHDLATLNLWTCIHRFLTYLSCVQLLIVLYMNCKNPGFLSFVNMYTGSWRIFLMSNYLVYCTWIEQALDSMIVWICTRVPEVSFYVQVFTWILQVLESLICEHVHVILADLPCVPYVICTSPGLLDCVNMYTLSWPIFLVYRTWIVQALDSLIVWTFIRYPGRSFLCTVHELY